MVHKKLKSLKIEGKRKKNIIDLFGIWANRKEEVKEMKKMIEADRRKFKLREVKL